jgi:hypothetical protein
MTALSSSPPPHSADFELRHTREARTRLWRVAIVSVFFALVLGANLLVGGVLMVKAFHTQGDQAGEAFRIGRVTFPMLDGVFCRNVLFDNTTVQTKEDKVSRCDDHAIHSEHSRTKFSWGGG